MDLIINYFWVGLITIMSLFFGSFANVVIYRLKHGGSVFWGHSCCPHCKHKLSVLDLIPLFSFLFLGRKCRYCKNPISWQYFTVELIFGITWFLVAINSTYPLNIYELIYLILILVVVFFLITIAVYDFLYTEIPDALSIGCMHTVILILCLPMGQTIISSLVGAFFIYSFFYLQILLPSAIYAFKNNDLKEIKSTLISYVLFPFWFALLLFLPIKIINKIPLFKDNGEDNSKVTYWIGGGDLRLAFVMGALLGIKAAVVALSIAYLLGALIGLILIGHNKENAKNMIPFGPFLAIGTFIALFWTEILWETYWQIIS